MVIDAEFRRADVVDVAIAVEDREGVAVLEHAPPVIHAGRGREDVISIVDADDFFGHDVTPPADGSPR